MSLLFYAANGSVGIAWERGRLARNTLSVGLVFFNELVMRLANCVYCAKRVTYWQCLGALAARPQYFAG